mmetsp:Transcript_10656/g.26083  ORF Transcript_10656/g.26083 Transcript_10656/m.26083 type:complete len:254 (+) Transcript_10656:2814-3575(+)
MPEDSARPLRPPHRGDRRPLQHPRREGGPRIRGVAGERGGEVQGGLTRDHACVFREAALDGRVEGLHQRPGSGRHEQHREGVGRSAKTPARHQRPVQAAVRDRVSGQCGRALSERSGCVGRDRSADNGEPNAPGNGEPAEVPGGLQKRHEWRRPGRCGCGGGRPAGLQPARRGPAPRRAPLRIARGVPASQSAVPDRADVRQCRRPRRSPRRQVCSQFRAQVRRRLRCEALQAEQGQQESRGSRPPLSLQAGD